MSIVYGSVQPGRVGKGRSVPSAIPRPEYVGRTAPAPFTGSEVRDPAMIEAIRHASTIAARALETVGAAVAPGVTTDELDAIGHQYLVDHDAYPSTLGYRGFPKSLCTSVNEVVCHGIPDDRPLREGEIVNVDITAYIGGVHGDTNATFLVGEVSPEAAALVEHTRESLNRAIKAAKPGRAINVIGRVISSYAKRHGLGVVRDFTGHGVGPAFHTGLIIPHYDAAPAYDTVIEPGMTFTIEPMLTLGDHECDVWDDGWTAVTRDRSLTAQFEHTLLITDTGAEILTLP